jgi:hypothetical protein
MRNNSSTKSNIDQILFSVGEMRRYSQTGFPLKSKYSLIPFSGENPRQIQ